MRASVEGGPLAERMGQLYFDTAAHHPAALGAAIATIGIDQVVLGTDYPPAGNSAKEAVDLIDRFGLEPGDRDKVLDGNARRLLDL